MSSKRESVVILGSTGSIGQQTLEVMSLSPDQFSVFALVANTSVDRMLQQCLQYRPQHAVMVCEKSAALLQQKLGSVAVEVCVHAGEQMAIDLVQEAEVDVVVAAIVGAAGLRSSIAAATAGKRILLANKEALVMSGELFLETVRENNACLLPVDSEHNAIFQVLPDTFLPGGSLPECVREIILTASGGPFRQLPLDQFDAITPEGAVAHPNWQMGSKISVDSATMMNKALEVIEAYYLFSLSPQQIKVLIHPQSIIHSMVRYCDGSVLAQLGVADMRIPIANALGWPDKLTPSGAANLDFSQFSALEFMTVCQERFPCLRLAYWCLHQQRDSMIVLNAANEIAVQAFLARKLPFSDIYRLVDLMLQQHDSTVIGSIDDVIAVDRHIRCKAQQALVAINKARI